VAQGPSKVIYDRKDSSFARLERGIDWEKFLHKINGSIGRELLLLIARNYLELKTALKIAQENHLGFMRFEYR
jgi:hypothetical protein